MKKKTKKFSIKVKKLGSSKVNTIKNIQLPKSTSWYMRLNKEIADSESVIMKSFDEVFGKVKSKKKLPKNFGKINLICKCVICRK